MSQNDHTQTKLAGILSKYESALVADWIKAQSTTSNNPGGLVKADETPLASVAARDPMHVCFDIDERTFLRLRRAIREGKIKDLTEPGLAARLSRAGREKAEQVDWSVVLPQWEALLEAVTGGARPGFEAGERVQPCA